MSEQLKKGMQGFWSKVIGDSEEVSLENRTFNYVNVVTFFALIYFLIFDLIAPQHLMSVILAVLVAVLGAVYYYARFRKKYRYGVIIYASCSYAVLILNYYLNSGINGPTICLFFLTFYLLIVIGKRRWYPVWIILHIAIIMALMISEYFYPDLAPNTYPSRGARFIDIGVTVIAAIAFIFLLTNYLTRQIARMNALAHEREKALLQQNEQIKAQNQQLARINDEKNKLFSIISHDLRSPLDSIRGYLEIMSMERLSPDDQAMIQEELQNQTRYTSELLQNLLFWSKSQMQGISANLASLQLKRIVEEVTGNKLPLAAKKGIKITHSIPPEIEVIADKDMLRIVLRNLVNNAIKFTPPGGEIFIKVQIDGNIAEISVKDSGIGIPKEKQSEIFQLKTNSTRGTNNEKGIGLGLMLCKEFVEYMGGKIRFKSEEGIGSTFFIDLPAARK